MLQDLFGNKPRGRILTDVKISLRGKKGSSVIEIMIIIAIITIAFNGLMKLVSFSLGVSTLVRETVLANNTSQEILEEVRNFRDGTVWNAGGIGTLATGTNYYFQATGTPPRFAAAAGGEVIDGFTRQVVFSDVKRDVNNNIAESAGTYDPDTKKATVTVFWASKGINRQISLVAYFTNWRQ